MQTYLALKSLHILGVVLFVGNIIVTGWWKVQADRTRHPAIVAFAQRQVTMTDWLFTFGGSTLVVVGAYANVYLHDLPLDAPWLVWVPDLLAYFQILLGVFKCSLIISFNFCNLTQVV